MGVASVKKLDLYAHNSVAETALAMVQKLGCCEVITPEGDDEPQGASSSLVDLDEKLSEARYLLRILEPLYIDTVSAIDRSFGERPELCLENLKRLAGSFDVKARAGDLRELERTVVEVRSEIAQIDGYTSLLSDLEGMPYPMGLLASGTEQVFGVLGTLPVDMIDRWRQALRDSFGDHVEVYVAPVGAKAKETWTAIVGLREHETKVLELAGTVGFAKVEVAKDLALSAPEEIQRLEARKVALFAQAQKLDEAMAEEAAKLVPTVRRLSDYWSILADRARAMESGEKTDELVLIRAWVPEDAQESLVDALTPLGEMTELCFSDPEEDENPPSCLDNKEWSLPFETLTKLYGAPKYGGIDPTPLLAPFFFVFFGMCLGDGGYGLIMVGFFLMFLKKYKRMPAGTKQFFSLFVLSGIAATLVGALTGSWLGDMIDVVPFLRFLKPVKDVPILLVPMNDPMAFLAISLVFGVIQIFFGMAVAMKDCLRKGDYMGAFADQLGWMVFLTGLLLFGVASKVSSMAGFACLVTVVGAVTLVVTQGRDKPGIVQKAISGILSLYNVTSYLGDVLSYSRLLALGLATSAIAMIINMLAGLSAGIPYVGWLIAVIIFLGGHLFSVAVNVLGAFVHSLRLQYVEFFSKFYSGGGHLFDPLRYDTKYVVIIDEGGSSR